MLGLKWEGRASLLGFLMLMTMGSLCSRQLNSQETPLEEIKGSSILGRLCLSQINAVQI